MSSIRGKVIILKERARKWIDKERKCKQMKDINDSIEAFERKVTMYQSRCIKKKAEGNEVELAYAEEVLKGITLALEELRALNKIIDMKMSSLI